MKLLKANVSFGLTDEEPFLISSRRKNMWGFSFALVCTRCVCMRRLSLSNRRRAEGSRVEAVHAKATLHLVTVMPKPRADLIQRTLF